MEERWGRESGGERGRRKKGRERNVENCRKGGREVGERKGGRELEVDRQEERDRG